MVTERRIFKVRNEISVNRFEFQVFIYRMDLFLLHFLNSVLALARKGKTIGGNI